MATPPAPAARGVVALDATALGAEVAAARSHAQAGRPAVALVRYRALRRRIERSRDAGPELAAQLARVLLGQAAAQFELSGRLTPAMALLTRAEELVATTHPGMLASVRGQRGLLLLRGGRRQEALRALDSAEQVRGPAPDYDVLTILLNRGVLRLDLGALAAAAADFEECVRIAERTSDSVLLWKARHNLAYVDFAGGRIPRALAAMEQAGRHLDSRLEPMLLLDHARVLAEAGLVSDASVLLVRAAADLRAAGLIQDAAETDLLRAGCLLVEGRFEPARQLAAAAERQFARRGNLQWRRRAQLMVLQCVRRTVDTAAGSGDDLAALRRLATRARRLARDCRAERRVDLARPAELLALECELRAGTAPTSSAPPLRSGDPLPARLQTREVRALLAAHRGATARAAAEVRRGLRELGDYQSGFGSLDLRTASAVHGLPLARLGLELADRSGSPADFFAAVERARAISTRLAPVSPPGDERTAGLLAELRRTREDARGLEGDPAATDDLTRLRTRASRLQRELRARAWELEAAGGPPPPGSARVTELREAARSAGTAFVTYVVHHGRWRAVVASARRPSMHDLAGAAQVTELVQRVRADLDALAMPVLPAPLSAAVRRSLAAGLRALDDLLLGPLALDGCPLVVSVSSDLGLLPWSLLPSRRGLPVVVTPSATAWLRSGPADRRSRPDVVSVAGPGLRRVDAEASHVHRTWPGARLLAGRQATTAAVRHALDSADVVHVAAHGTHQQESPLFSSLRLVDGPLFAYELDADRGAARCVVLSACEAGLATVRPGDEGLGLTAGLLHLGTRSVLAGVARVRDDVAARVMQAVHGAMAAGVDSACALAEALADEQDPAGFVAFGRAW